MARFIVLNSTEINLGVSVTTLTLAEKLNFISGKKICIVELDYENPSLSYFLEREQVTSQNIDGIIPYIRDKAIVDNEVIMSIRNNIKSFKNSDIDIIYGKKRTDPLENNTLRILLKALGELYDIILIDYGNKKLPEVLKESIDLNLLVVQPSYRYIDNLKNNNYDYLLKKTQLIFNECNGLSDISANEKIKDISILGYLPASNTLIESILKGIISIEKGEYSKKISQMAYKICNSLDIPINMKRSFFNKLFNIAQ